MLRYHAYLLQNLTPVSGLCCHAATSAASSAPAAQYLFKATNASPPYTRPEQTLSSVRYRPRPVPCMDEAPQIHTPPLPFEPTRSHCPSDNGNLAEKDPNDTQKASNAIRTPHAYQIASDTIYYISTSNGSPFHSQPRAVLNNHLRFHQHNLYISYIEAALGLTQTDKLIILLNEPAFSSSLF